MGFSGNGMQSIRYNHGMLRGRGKSFVKNRKYINVNIVNLQVNEARMDKLAKEAKQSAVINIVLAIIFTAIIFLMISTLS